MNMHAKKYFSFFQQLLLFGAGIIFSVVLLIFVIQHYSFNEAYFRQQFQKNNISAATGFTDAELAKIIRQMTGYLAGQENSFNLTLPIDGKEVFVFNDRELAHMLDVKVIYVLLNKIKQAGLWVLSAILIPYTLYIYFSCRKHRSAKTVFLFRRYRMNIAKLFAFNALFTLLLISGLGFMLLTDFSKYFIRFHEIFFDNDLWLLNPKTDRLIQMLPEVFFYDISFKMVERYALISLSLGAAGLAFFLFLKREESSI